MASKSIYFIKLDMMMIIKKGNDSIQTPLLLNLFNLIPDGIFIYRKEDDPVRKLRTECFRSAKLQHVRHCEQQE